MNNELRVHGGIARYRVVRPWQKLPCEQLYPISSLALDADDRVYLLRRERPMIQVFDADGTLVDTLDHERLTSAHGIRIGPDGRIYVSTYDAQQILIFDADHRLAGELGEFGQPRWRDPFNSPTGLAVAPDGDIYVADGYGNARVHRFRLDGTHLKSWGDPGDGPGAFSTPHAVAVLPDDRVIVCDRDNDRLQVFSRDGDYIEQWRPFVRPMDVWVDSEGRVYVSEQTPRISICAPSGQVIGRFHALGVYPHGICGDRHGNLFVAELGPVHQITKYEVC